MALLPLKAQEGSTFWSGSSGQQWRLGQRITADDLVAAAAAAATAAADGGAGRSGSRRSNVTLAELVHSGIVQPGEHVITVTYKSLVYTASLNVSGAIEFEGATFTSPTAFSIHVKRKQTPGKQGDDGWQSVHYLNIPLAQFRKDYLDRGAGAGSSRQQQLPSAAAASQQHAAAPAAMQAQGQEPSALGPARALPPRATRGSGRAKRPRKGSRYSESDEDEGGAGGSYAALEEEEQAGAGMALDSGAPGMQLQPGGPSPLKIDGQIVVDLPPGAQVDNADEWVQCERCQVWRLVPKEHAQAVHDDPRQEWFCEYAAWDVASQPPHTPACEAPTKVSAASAGGRRRGRRQ